MATAQWKKYLVLAAFAMALTGTSVALAAPDQGKMSQENYAKVESIIKDHQKAMDSTKKQLLVKEAELRGQLESVNPDKGAIESLSKDIGELRGRLLSDRVKMNQEFEKQGLPVMRGMGHGSCGGMFGPMRGDMHGDMYERMDRGHMGERMDRGHMEERMDRGHMDGHGERYKDMNHMR